MPQFGQGQERRREPRAQIACPVYLETSGPNGERFEEVRTTRDLGRWGYYFLTERESYRQSMQVHAIPAVGHLNCEYEGEVVRVEHLPEGEFGIAVRLLCVRKTIGTPKAITRFTFDSFARAEAPLGAAPILVIT
jgi:hypothetical protein